MLRILLMEVSPTGGSGGTTPPPPPTDDTGSTGGTSGTGATGGKTGADPGAGKGATEGAGPPPPGMDDGQGFLPMDTNPTTTTTPDQQTSNTMAGYNNTGAQQQMVGSQVQQGADDVAAKGGDQVQQRIADEAISNYQTTTTTADQSAFSQAWNQASSILTKFTTMIAGGQAQGNPQGGSGGDQAKGSQTRLPLGPTGGGEQPLMGTGDQSQTPLPQEYTPGQISQMPQPQQGRAQLFNNLRDQAQTLRGQATAQPPPSNANGLLKQAQGLEGQATQLHQEIEGELHPHERGTDSGDEVADRATESRDGTKTGSGLGADKRVGARREGGDTGGGSGGGNRDGETAAAPQVTVKGALAFLSKDITNTGESDDAREMRLASTWLNGPCREGGTACMTGRAVRLMYGDQGDGDGAGTGGGGGGDNPLDAREVDGAPGVRTGMTDGGLGGRGTIHVDVPGMGDRIFSQYEGARALSYLRNGVPEGEDVPPRVATLMGLGEGPLSTALMGGVGDGPTGTGHSALRETIAMRARAMSPGTDETRMSRPDPSWYSSGMMA